ncbi:amino acid ABC transporter ATP-binding protein [Clostridium cylindrosporum]|uniref:Glutamine transport ATP-binding protein GlnQ n=1 Tax=Clostridium cylindrosporum DSM 605 TaxID=1121307 RepID=A0A0J8DCF5_CLOCY|nr:amino acid ABC transporter ATP-binding protein [Clostridium cylindrosporum]KMT21984.1 glutamine transport ATP-binding protein GlnQ [Clostridium cylindrosporum DSM 605]
MEEKIFKEEEVLIELHNVNKFFGDKHILKNINLQIHKGEVIVILGPSGCGKSTLLRCLNGLEDVQSGEINFKTKLLTSKKTNWRQIRQDIGMVFQSYELFPHMTVMDNILLGPLKVQRKKKEEVLGEVEVLLKKVGLLDKKNSYPRELSGGQKQRIAIVRSLAMNPELMLFDEVTAALDPEMVKEVLEVILSLANEGRTMAIVTHEIGFARAVADRIIFINEGEICEISDPVSFFKNPKTERARHFLSQFTYIENMKGRDIK